jgi:hypothetical protein
MISNGNSLQSSRPWKVSNSTKETSAKQSHVVAYNCARLFARALPQHSPTEPTHPRFTNQYHERRPAGRIVRRY